MQLYANWAIGCKRLARLAGLPQHLLDGLEPEIFIEQDVEYLDAGLDAEDMPIYLGHSRDLPEPRDRFGNSGAYPRNAPTRLHPHDMWRYKPTPEACGIECRFPGTVLFPRIF